VKKTIRKLKYLKENGRKYNENGVSVKANRKYRRRRRENENRRIQQCEKAEIRPNSAAAEMAKIGENEEKTCQPAKKAWRNIEKRQW
jgi:hypothetical protein